MKIVLQVEKDTTLSKIEEFRGELVLLLRKHEDVISDIILEF
jgi:hypothetical protein